MSRAWTTVTRLGVYSQGEVPSPLQITFTDSSSVALNLTGFTADFVIECKDGQVVSGLGMGVSEVITPLSGITRYTWSSLDFGTTGLFRGQMWVDDGTNTYASEVYEWFVTQDTTSPY